MLNENLIQNQIKNAFVYVSVRFGQAIVSTRNEKQGAFFDREKKPPTGPPLVQWRDYVSFFLLPLSKETQGEGERKRQKEETKLPSKKKKKKENEKKDRQKESLMINST